MVEFTVNNSVYKTSIDSNSQIYIIRVTAPETAFEPFNVWHEDIQRQALSALLDAL